MRAEGRVRSARDALLAPWMEVLSNLEALVEVTIPLNDR